MKFLSASLNTNATWLGTKRKMKTRKQLMQELNKLLKTDFNWSRLSKLDLERLVKSIHNKLFRIALLTATEEKE